METLPLFPLEEFEQEAAQVQEYEAEEARAELRNWPLADHLPEPERQENAWICKE